MCIVYLQIQRWQRGLPAVPLRPQEADWEPEDQNLPQLFIDKTAKSSKKVSLKVTCGTIGGGGICVRVPPFVSVQVSMHCRG